MAAIFGAQEVIVTMALCAVKLGVTSVPTVTKMCRSIEYLLLSTKLEVSVNGSSVNDEEMASLAAL